MAEYSSPATVSEPVRGHKSFTAIDPLDLYESQSIGAEFRSTMPVGHDPRDTDARRNDVILKTWRGVPTIKDKDSTAVRAGLAGVRDFEVREAANADRYFLIALALMTMLLAIVFAVFIATIS